MTEIYHNGFLHTNSSYFAKESFFKADKKNSAYKELFSATNIANDYMRAIDHARSKELAFYHSIFPNVSDYESFMRELRKLLNDCNKVGEKIDRLSNISFKGDYYFPTSSQQFDYVVIIDATDLNRYGIEMEEISTDTFTFEGGKYYFNMNVLKDLKFVKRIINKIKQVPQEYEENYQPFHRSHIRTTTPFKESSEATEALQKYIDKELEEIAGEEVQILSKEISKGVTLTKTPIGEETVVEGTGRTSAADLPMNKMTGTQINDLIKSGDPEKIAIATKARQDVKNFLMKRLEINCDPLFAKAFHIAWSKLNEDFFFEGRNLVKGVLGNPGEFALDLVLNYANLKAGQYGNVALSGIIGDIVKGNRGQPRSDYECLVAIGEGDEVGYIGMQVKNYDTSRFNDIEVNTDLGLMAPNLGEDITTSLANYKFNASIANELGNMSGMFKDYLDKFIWRALNFDVNPNLMPEHTNTFYFLGGNKLIPVSEFMMSLGNPGGKKNLAEEYISDKKEIIEKPETTVTGLDRGKITDEKYAEGEPPLFVKYWLGNEDIGWKPSSSNEGEFQNLLAGVRINSVLKFASFLNVHQKGRYDMY